MSSTKNSIQYFATNESDTPVGKLAQMLLWIAPNPDEVTLHIAEGVHKTLIEIDVKAADRGRIIGKGGSIITSLRYLLYAALKPGDPDFDVTIPDGGRQYRYSSKTSRENYNSSDNNYSKASRDHNSFESTE